MPASKSLARRRSRLIQARKRSTTHRRGGTWKPIWSASLWTTSMAFGARVGDTAHPKLFGAARFLALSARSRAKTSVANKFFDVSTHCDLARPPVSRWCPNRGRDAVRGFASAGLAAAAVSIINAATSASRATQEDSLALMNIRPPIGLRGRERPIKTTEANRAVPDARRAGRPRGPTGGWPGSRAPRDSTVFAHDSPTRSTGFDFAVSTVIGFEAGSWNWKV